MGRYARAENRARGRRSFGGGFGTRACGSELLDDGLLDSRSNLEVLQLLLEVGFRSVGSISI